ncbi:unnamed protein product [Miscanthus lutarioriparius]|uniref:Leucine-rich repeat-containing N-terminal plant-type domain-containing protein n=1 Tax=Miscanthus lutarioriparius TaxID=422564 RepID=A0A811MZT3_9POAL|nr:unnamed protein product [Miscanthus lutarioriparius]
MRLLQLLLLLAVAAGAAGAAGSGTDTDADALLAAKAALSDPTGALASWDAASSDHCTWAGVTCAPRGSGGVVVGLDVSGLNLSGALPPALSRLRGLQRLSVAANGFYGPIPRSLARLQLLVHLNLSNNAFNSSFPPALARLRALRVLDLYNNNLTSATLPLEVTHMTMLRHLHLGGNFFSGEIPPEYGRWPRLQYLAVNGLTGSIPSELGYLKSLSSLDLSNNALTGEIPASFSELKNLTLLNLFRNKLRGDIPDFVGDLPASRCCSCGEQLHRRCATQPRPQRPPPAARPLVEQAHRHAAAGALRRGQPADAHRARQLLVRCRPRLTRPVQVLEPCPSRGELLEWLNSKGLFELPKLTQVELQDNLLTGNFPAVIGAAAPNLGEISLSNNQLTGALPASLGNFSGVQKLLLDQNAFSGAIPPEIGRLQQLSKADLSSNKFEEVCHRRLGNAGFSLTWT